MGKYILQLMIDGILKAISGPVLFVKNLLPSADLMSVMTSVIVVFSLATIFSVCFLAIKREQEFLGQLPKRQND